MVLVPGTDAKLYKYNRKQTDGTNITSKSKITTIYRILVQDIFKGGEPFIIGDGETAERFNLFPSMDSLCQLLRHFVQRSPRNQSFKKIITRK